jgi:hypothetical protein
LVILAIWVGFIISEKLGEKNDTEDQLTLSVVTQKKEIKNGEEVTLHIEIKNENLTTYKKTYESPCEELWTVEWEKDGKSLNNTIKDCENTTTKNITFKVSQLEKFILKKELTKPGKYKVTVNVFGNKISKEIVVGKQEEKKK